MFDVEKPDALLINVEEILSVDEEDGITSFNWEVPKNTTGVNSDSGCCDGNEPFNQISTEVSEKLTILTQLMTNSGSPQLEYLKVLLASEMQNFALSLDQYIENFNKAINVQQNAHICQNGNSGCGQQVLFSIPLNAF